MEALETFTTWQTLPSSTDTNQTDLYRLRIGKRRYKLQLTDLCDLWSERLEGQELIDRAHDYGSSIDPGLDHSQSVILLNKFRDAFNGSPGTKVKGRRQMTKDAVRIGIECELGNGLPSLRWQFRLSLQSKEDMRACVIMPLAGKVYSQSQSHAAMTALLREKDEAISKILDKIESSGLDMSSIFPTASINRTGRKASIKAQMMEHVKGLKPFDDKSFNSSASFSPTDVERRNLLQAAFSGTDWNASDGARSIEDAAKHEPMSSSSRSTLKQTAPDDDGYQRQPTPPTISRPSREKPSHVASADASHMHSKTEDFDDDTTDEDAGDDLDTNTGLPTPSGAKVVSEPEDNQISSNFTTPAHMAAGSATMSPAKGKKIGTIGRREPTVLPAENEESPTRKHDANNRDNDNVSRSQPTKGLPKPKLGKIGGRIKMADDPRVEKCEASIAANVPMPSFARGPEVERTTSPARSRGRPDLVNEQARTTEPPPPSTSPGPSSQERAQQKREQLKEQLEAQSKAQSKKKRKF